LPAIQDATQPLEFPSSFPALFPKARDTDEGIAGSDNNLESATSDPGALIYTRIALDLPSRQKTVPPLHSHLNKVVGFGAALFSRKKMTTSQS
jgi:hypothetical protein